MNVSEFDVNRLYSREVTMICYSANTIALHLDSDFSITLLHSYEVISGGLATINTVGNSESRLNRFLGMTISSVEYSSDSGDLLIHFSDWDTLRCIRDSQPYEAYSVTDGDLDFFA
jgi:hypothetical protein